MRRIDRLARDEVKSWAIKANHTLALAFTLATAEVGSPGLPPPNACARAGLLGTCSGCICCCGPSPGVAPLLSPVGCECVVERLDTPADLADRTLAVAAAAALVIFPAVFALAWFGRCCCGSPYEEDAWEEEEV